MCKVRLFIVRKTRKRKKNTKSLNALLLTAVLILLAGLTAVFFFVQRQINSEIVENAGMSVHADLSSRYITHNGIQYLIKRNLSTVLLIGTDSFAEDTDRIVEGQNRNRDLSDFIVLLVIDHNKQTITPLQLNRDTICEVPWLDEKGEIGGYHTEHLAFAHTYGSGQEDSCQNTIKTVRKLLYNAPITDYVAFTMDAVPLMNDLVGGVTVTLTEDMPSLGKKYVKGAEITLAGNKALNYIRYREDKGGSNWFRMKRHQQYLHAFIESTKKAAKENPELAIDAFKLIGPYMCTNLTINTMASFVEQLCSYTIKDTLTPSGDIVPGESFYEFHVHEDSLWECVYNAYCNKNS